MTCKEPQPQSFGLFYVVHFGDKGLGFPSHFFQIPQSKTAECNLTSAACKAFIHRLEAEVCNKNG